MISTLNAFLCTAILTAWGVTWAPWGLRAEQVREAKRAWVDQVFAAATLDGPTWHRLDPGFFEIDHPSRGRTATESGSGPGGRWQVGVGEFFGVHGLAFDTASAEHDSRYYVFFMNALREGFARLHDDQMGFALHMRDARTDRQRAFYALDLGRPARMSARDLRALPRAMRGAGAAHRRFVRDLYRQRLPEYNPVVDRLLAIAERIESRTWLFFESPESFVDTRNGGMVALSDGAGMPEAFRMKGAIMIVHSASAAEPLGLELDLGIEVPRAEGETIYEAGRYAVREGARERTSLRLVQQLAAVLSGIPGARRMLIQVDETHARLFAKYGFREIFRTSDTRGTPDRVLAADPLDVLVASLVGLPAQLIEGWSPR